MRVRGEKEMYEQARAFLEKLQSKKRATVVGLKGDLGAGKTTFVKGLAGALGVTETVTSPTFVIMKPYETRHDVFKKLIHVDAYRVDDAKELELLGWDEWISEGSSLIALEWPERVAEILPDDAIEISLEVIDENTREIDISYGKEE